MNSRYKVVGKGPYAVVMRNGVIEYDLLESKAEATEICAILNRGIGPEWKDVEQEMKQASA